MDEENKIILWFPSEKEREKVIGLCNKCIDVLSELPRIEQKAFALAQLVSSFEEMSGIKFEAIISTYKNV